MCIFVMTLCDRTVKFINLLIIFSNANEFLLFEILYIVCKKVRFFAMLWFSLYAGVTSFFF